MKVIICGGRQYWNWDYLKAKLDGIHAETPITHVIQGGARGADTLASRWASQANVPQTCIEADWKRYGRIAGPIRNNEMADLKPDAVIAFPGGKGTACMIGIARARKIPVIKV
jgi:hypothetical protein